MSCIVIYMLYPKPQAQGRSCNGCAQQNNCNCAQLQVPYTFRLPQPPPLHDALRDQIDMHHASTDVLRDPYDPPLRDSRVHTGVPINIPTQSVDTTYRQVGILTNGDRILPLMGRPLFTNRDKWNFYTMTDKSNMIKLPIVYKGKNCTSEYGCQNVFSNDEVHVEGYNDTFKATMYENDTLRYIPHL